MELIQANTDNISELFSLFANYYSLILDQSLKSFADSTISMTPFVQQSKEGDQQYSYTGGTEADNSI